MEKYGDMVLYDFEEYLDDKYGPIGTPKRDAFEAEVAEDVRKSQLRRERREARKAKLQSLVSPIVNAINSVSEGQTQVARS